MIADSIRNSYVRGMKYQAQKAHPTIRLRDKEILLCTRICESQMRLSSFRKSQIVGSGCIFFESSRSPMFSDVESNCHTSK